jgi:FkbM family methyltransferase
MIKNILNKFQFRKTSSQLSHQRLASIKIEDSDIAIDCGANVGNITHILSRTGATVYCFEPNPYAFAALQERFSKMENVHCIQKGVSDKDDTMKLYLHENSSSDELLWSTGSSLLDFKSNVSSKNYVEVDIIDLSEFIEKLDSRIRVLKMDVEGVECMILKRLINDGIIDKIDYTFVETHDHKIPELKDETDEIRELISNNNIENIDLDWK